MRERLAPSSVRSSSIHGKGVFADRKILKGEYLGTYRGRRTQRDSKYVLWVRDGTIWAYGILGSSKLKYVNHSNKPNAGFDDGFKIYAIKNIKKDEEITWNYGPEWRE